MAKHIGKRVAKTFDDEQGEPLGLFRGIVMRYIDSIQADEDDDNKNNTFLVTYDDGDSENVGIKELHDMLELFKEVGEEIKFKSKKAYRHEIYRRAKDYYYQIMDTSSNVASSCAIANSNSSTTTDNASDSIAPTLKSKLWNMKVRTNIYFHLCQTMKPLGGIFPCNQSYHSYCEFHLKVSQIMHHSHFIPLFKFNFSYSKKDSFRC